MLNEQELRQLHDKIAELEETVVHQRARADRAETFICTMCSECEWEENDGMLFMQKSCCSLFPLDCNKFKLRSLWIPVRELPMDKSAWYLTCDHKGNMHTMFHHKMYEVPFCIYDNHPRYFPPKWFMPLPEPPKEVE